MSSQARDRHRDPPLTVRPPAGLKEDALKALKARDRETKAFVVACLNALVADPDGFLERLDKHWPVQTPRGRPRKTTTPAAPQQRQQMPPSGGPEPWSEIDEAPRAMDPGTGSWADDDIPSALDILGAADSSPED
ncbi:hypothetical protein [Streptomyces sp. HUAS TT20]|uniref:hypothetical protein n=1 Tax=Streptomyces sp. HUAS TT20 TaxID=3447509 RepID=UPI0021DB56DA|nr:hypothetical protein [Streptomyces sp. HUAS 15-9]UXY32044.1 hypothetical protein N8I87_39495 [Streptomyces sp. HUAS 15-9]